MKALIVALAFGVGLPVSAFAQDAPPFVKAIAPQASVSPAWQEWMAVFNPKGALDGKTKELYQHSLIITHRPIRAVRWT